MKRLGSKSKKQTTTNHNNQQLQHSLNNNNKLPTLTITSLLVHNDSINTVYLLSHSHNLAHQLALENFLMSYPRTLRSINSKLLLVRAHDCTFKQSTPKSQPSSLMLLVSRMSTWENLSSGLLDYGRGYMIKKPINVELYNI